jgi:hypothetical protein
MAPAFRFLAVALIILGATMAPPARGGVPKTIVAEHFGDCC